MKFEKIKDVAIVTPGTSPKGVLINSDGFGLPFFQGSKEFGELYPVPARYTQHPVKVAKSGDILISVRAPVGEVNIAPQDCSIGRGVMSVRAKVKSEQLFLFYFLKSLQGKWDSLGSTGSVFENLSTVALNDVNIPSGINRELVGKFLFRIDQKIAVNNSLSKILEKIAQTIFKSWFIDFDPVKAKMAGEKPVGMDSAIASLFPDSMEESVLGLIPKGWEVKIVGDVLEVTGGTTPSTSNADYWDGEHCWTTPKDLSNQVGLITTESSRKITDAGLAQISSGLLPVDSVLMSCRAPIGYISVNAVPTAVNQGFIALKSSEIFPALFLTSWLESNMQEIKSRAGGATFAEITRKTFRELSFLVPNQNVLDNYSKITMPILKQLKQLTLQNKNLQEMRNSLLPRLISGELPIPEEMLAS